MKRRSKPSGPITLVFNAEALQMLLHWRGIAQSRVRIPGFEDLDPTGFLSGQSRPGLVVCGGLNKLLNADFMLSLNNQIMRIVWSGEVLEMVMYWRGLSAYDLALKTGMSEQHIGQLIYGNKRPGPPTLAKFNKALNVYLYTTA